MADQHLPPFCYKPKSQEIWDTVGEAPGRKSSNPWLDSEISYWPTLFSRHCQKNLAGSGVMLAYYWSITSVQYEWKKFNIQQEIKFQVNLSWSKEWMMYQVVILFDHAWRLFFDRLFSFRSRNQIASLLKCRKSLWRCALVHQGFFCIQERIGSRPWSLFRNGIQTGKDSWSYCEFCRLVFWLTTVIIDAVCRNEGLKEGPGRENSYSCLQCSAKWYVHQCHTRVEELHWTTTCFWFRGCVRPIWHAISHLKCSASLPDNTGPQKSKWGHIHIPSIAPDKSSPFPWLWWRCAHKKGKWQIHFGKLSSVKVLLSWQADQDSRTT